MILADFHIHTSRSFDGFSTWNQLLSVCIRKHLNLVAVTDHDIAGVPDHVVEKFKQAGILLVSGCENSTSENVHIIGLNQKSPVTGYPILDTVRLLQDQSCMILLPHPFSSSGLLRPGVNAIPHKVVNETLLAADLIEIANSGRIISDEIYATKQIAGEYELRIVTGSDAHKPWHVGVCRTIISLDHSRAESLKPEDLYQIINGGAFHYEVEVASGESRAAEHDSSSIRKLSERFQLIRYAVKVMPRWFKRVIHQAVYAKQYLFWKLRISKSADCSYGRIKV